MRRDLFTGDLLEKIKEVYLSPGGEAVKAPHGRGRAQEGPGRRTELFRDQIQTFEHVTGLKGQGSIGVDLDDLLKGLPGQVELG